MALDKGKKKLLGEYLIEQGLVNKDQIQKALEEQRKAGSRLGQTLIDLGFLKEEELIVALARQLGLAHIDILSYRLKPDVVNLIPEKMARRYEVIALEKVSNELTIAMADPLNVFAIDEIQQITQCRIEPVICSRNSLFKVLDLAYKGEIEQPKPQITIPAPGPQEQYSKVQSDSSRDQVSSVDGQEIIELVNTIVTTCVGERATDIHIEPDEEEIRIRCRVDGFLREMMKYPKEVQLPMISRIKVMSGLDISEKRIPQDGRFQFTIGEREIDLRISTLPTILGEKVVMRVLDKSMVVIDLENLGFLPENLAVKKL